MAVPYEKLVEEDLNLGYGDVDVTMPAGGTATGTKIGLHTFMQMFNVKTFGAVGDGVTPSAAAFQAAIDAAEDEGGGTVWVPCGVYAIGTTLTVPSFVRILGDGQPNYFGSDETGSLVTLGSTILRQTNVSMTALFTATSASGVVFENLALAGINNGTTQTGTAVGIKVVTLGKSIKVLRSLLYGFGGYGMDAAAMDSNSLISDSVFSFNKGGGARWVDSNDNAIVDSYFINNRLGFDPETNDSTRSHGLELNNCKTTRVHNCKLEWSNGYGLWMHTTSNECIITNNVFDHNSYAGLFADTVSNCLWNDNKFQRNAVSGNTANSDKSSNVYLDTVTGCTFADNLSEQGHFLDDGTGTIYPYNGVIIESTTRLLAQNNRIRDGANGGADITFTGTNAFLHYSAVGAYRGAQFLITDGSGNTLWSYTEQDTSAADTEEAQFLVGRSMKVYSRPTSTNPLLELLNSSGTVKFRVRADFGIEQIDCVSSAFGTTRSLNKQIVVGGSFTGAGSAAGAAFRVATAVTPGSGQSGYGLEIEPTFVKHSSGTHATFAAVSITAPTISGSGSTVTNACSLYISAAPSGGTNNFSIWIDAGTPRIDFTSQSTVGAAGGASALPATPSGYAVFNLGGSEFVLPYYAKS